MHFQNYKFSTGLSDTYPEKLANGVEMNILIHSNESYHYFSADKQFVFNQGTSSAVDMGP